MGGWAKSQETKKGLIYGERILELRQSMLDREGLSQTQIVSLAGVLWSSGRGPPCPRTLFVLSSCSTNFLLNNI